MIPSTNEFDPGPVFDVVLRRVTSAESLGGPDFPCLGRLARLLEATSRDDALGLLVLTARLMSRDDAATMVIRVSPGLASVGLILPSALSGASGGAVGSAITQATGSLRIPMTLEEELFTVNIELRPEWSSAVVGARVLHEMRLLWLYTMQVALNLGSFGAKSVCSVLSDQPLFKARIADFCDGSPISVIQADSRMDGRILSFVECHLPEGTLRQKLVASGLEVVGSQATVV
jgi:hypothetical protein